MSKILDFFISLGDIISGAVGFLIHSIKELLTVVQLALKVFSQIPSYFSWLPSGLLSILIVIFTVVVIYKLAGREG